MGVSVKERKGTHGVLGGMKDGKGGDTDGQEEAGKEEKPATGVLDSGRLLLEVKAVVGVCSRWSGRWRWISG